MTLEAIAAQENLIAAWRRVRRNKGGPGGDGVTLEVFERDLDRRLLRLRMQVLAEEYKPGKLRRSWIRKPAGGKRKLAIPTVADRVVQTAAMLALGMNIDARLSGSSWAYREGRGVKDALAMVRQARADGFLWTLDADITQYFDRIPHRRLLEEATIWIGDMRIVRLLRLWLRSFSFWGRGIAQGSPISPLLANMFLHPMDRFFEVEGLRAVRYADDFVVLCRTEREAAKALTITASHLAARGLKLNRNKTRIVKPEEAFSFLGETMEGMRRA